MRSIGTSSAFFAFALVIVTHGCKGDRSTNGATRPRFEAADGEALPDMRRGAERLDAFFGAAVPEVVHVSFVPTGTSLFHPETDSVVLSRATIQGSPAPALVHETAHLSLWHFTHGASMLEALRFLDEGVASMFEHELDGSSDYEAVARAAAALRRDEGKVGLDAMGRWSTFFGKPSQRPPAPDAADWGAYDAAASFVLFVRSRFGEPRLVELLRQVGVTRSLDPAIRTALGRERRDVEAEWLASLAEARRDRPAVASWSPSPDAERVPIDTRELVVAFDVDMSGAICVNTPCDQGVCYDHARWRTPRELVIAVDPRLVPRHEYVVELGMRTCHLKSARGFELPITPWRFRTE